jgi:hypothetical protein
MAGSGSTPTRPTIAGHRNKGSHWQRRDDVLRFNESSFEGSRPTILVNMMQRLSRITGLISAVFLVAFVLVTSGFACIDSAGPDTMAKMGMTRSATNSGAIVHASAATLPTPAPAPTAPCRFPWAPDGCQSMVPCSAAALASASAQLNHPAPVPERVASASAVAPPSITTPPELPPPRA